MNKKELFKKYKIDSDEVKKWEQPDSWFLVEIYRTMHDGKLPPPDDMSIKWVIDFLDKAHDELTGFQWLHSLKDWGSKFLTAKRSVYRFADEILRDLSEER